LDREVIFEAQSTGFVCRLPSLADGWAQSFDDSYWMPAVRSALPSVLIFVLAK
jgi:hypothetical protein